MTGTAPLTAEQLADIRQREAAASEGPWRVENDPKDLHRWVVSDASPTVEIDFGYVGNRSQDDAEFVAHARQNVPALLAELDRLRAELASARRRSETATGQLLHFAAEAHRRKWAYDNGGEGPTLAAFAALHRLGDEMRASVDSLTANPTT